LEVTGDRTRIGELTLDVFVFLERQYILSRADEGHDQRTFESRLTNRLH
jgi:hypothetical protein